MRNKSTIIFAVFSLVLASMACSVFEMDNSSTREEPLAEESPQPAHEEAVLPESAPEADITLGEELVNELGGFNYQAIPGYQVETNFGLVEMKFPGADIEVGPALILIGAAAESPATLEELYAQLEDDLEPGGEVVLSDPHEELVGGYPARVADIYGFMGDVPVGGKVAIVVVSHQQHFTMIGFGPIDRWEGEVAALFDLELQAVSFFEPIEMVFEGQDDAELDVPESQTEEIRQWAATAHASSEYSNPDWSAEQAAGAPDTLGCEDAPTAWASAERTGVDWLELHYEIPVDPTEINIYQNHMPNQVSLVELLDIQGEVYPIYQSDPEILSECPYILSIPVDLEIDLINGVRVHIDQSYIELTSWNEIDAVELVGHGGSGSEGLPIETDAGGTGASTTEADQWDYSAGTWTTFTTNDGLGDNIIKALAVAPDGSLWIGDGNVGVTHYDSSNWTVYTRENGLGANNANAVIVAPDGTVWAGTGWGLARFDGSGWTNFTTDEGLVSNAVSTLAVAPDGTLWIGAKGGISQFDGTNFNNYTVDDGLVDSDVRAIAVDSAGVVWIGTGEGVSSFDGQYWNTYTETEGLAYKRVNAITVAPDGALWFGTAGQGASRFDGQNWETFRDDNGLVGYSIASITVGPDGALWFGTEGNGVYRFDGQDWNGFTEADGLAKDWVDAVVVSQDGILWASARGAGLSQLIPAE
jgi:streptogramin lyase